MPSFSGPEEPFRHPQRQMPLPKSVLRLISFAIALTKKPRDSLLQNQPRNQLLSVALTFRTATSSIHLHHYLDLDHCLRPLSLPSPFITTFKGAPPISAAATGPLHSLPRRCRPLQPPFTTHHHRTTNSLHIKSTHLTSAYTAPIVPKATHPLPQHRPRPQKDLHPMQPAPRNLDSLRRLRRHETTSLSQLPLGHSL